MRVWFVDLTCSVGKLIVGLPGNRKDSLFIPTRELTEDISSIFSQLSTNAHTGVDQDVIHVTKYNNDGYSMMDDINESGSLSC